MPLDSVKLSSLFTSFAKIINCSSTSLLFSLPSFKNDFFFKKHSSWRQQQQQKSKARGLYLLILPCITEQSRIFTFPPNFLPTESVQFEWGHGGYLSSAPHFCECRDRGPSPQAPLLRPWPCWRWGNSCSFFGAMFIIFLFSYWPYFAFLPQATKTIRQLSN